MAVRKTQSRNNIFIAITFILGALLIVILNKYYKSSIKTASYVVGGLGLFIFGMKMMSDGLQEIAGDKLRKTLKFLTSNRIAGILTGVGITAIIQSSSATTVMLVGFVNSGLVTLTQAAGVILGANIGTTVTGQLIAFKLKVLALPAIAVGSAMFIFGKRERTKIIGKVALGFGILFFAMGIMSSPLKVLRNNDDFRNLFVKFSSNPIFGLLAGTILTVVVQSSSVTVAITMSLASAGLISFSAAIPVILGDNIGTTITALLASIGTNLAAKRAAIVHTLFNVFGAVVILVLLNPYMHLIDKITPGDVPVNEGQITRYIQYSYAGKNIKPLVKINDKYVAYNENKHKRMQIFMLNENQYIKVDKKKLNGNVPYMLRHVANSHTVFNLLNVLLWLPLLSVLTWAARKIYRGEEEVEGEFVKYIDKRMLQTPPIAIGQIEAETLRMLKITGIMLNIDLDLYNDFKLKEFNRLIKKEKIVNMLENSISEYAYLLFDKSLTTHEKDIVNFCLNSIHEIERIGDHCVSIAESLEFRSKNNIDFSKHGEEEFVKMFKMVMEIHTKVVDLFENKQMNLIQDIKILEEKIDLYEEKARKKHIKRMNKKVCTPGAGIIFVDVLNNLERLADHAHNVASLINDESLNIENRTIQT